MRKSHANKSCGVKEHREKKKRRTRQKWCEEIDKGNRQGEEEIKDELFICSSASR